MKLKVLLADDEIPILKNLQIVVPWEELGLEVIGTAKNGEIALELAREHRPHLILCDIRMPVMDGIEFLKALREFDSDTEVIMMTGYQDFSYVRSVIRYEVRDYVLKPIDYEELAQTISRLASGIRERSEEQQSIQREWRQVFHLAYEKVLYDLLNDVGGNSSKPFLPYRGLGGDELNFVMMLVDVEEYSRKEWLWNEKERKLWNFAIHNVLQENLQSFEVPHSVLQVRSGEWCVLIELESPDVFELEQCRAWAAELRQAVGRYLKLGIRVALHAMPVPLERLARVYKQLQRSLHLERSSDGGILVPVRSTKGLQEETQKLWDRIEEMVTGLKRCDRRKTETALKDLNESFLRLPETSIERVEPILHYICLHLIREMRSMDVIGRQDEMDYWSQIDRSPGIRETLALINRLVDQSITSVMKKKTSDVLMLSAKDYIERNLSSDLSIDMLADYLGISGSYFSLLFKQHFGDTFVEYVTKQRMEMAKSMLALSDKSVTHIGQMVGYGERRYFTRVFSKYTGMLPSEYRERAHQRPQEPILSGWTAKENGS
ncbi:response regulator [Cohnella lubricantis]|uniref:Response regulator n=1 Tax=Cohnella lubricantis TaxID=2163172 RepID=A0A841TDQ1_9BACL|nr:response regulator [Cohnella lubricantis]MBB6679573.1 response regulator [Cohnella lubricantis]MBP2120581.1 two-component system response regulator YesN [Cohnella lubricantis]